MKTTNGFDTLRRMNRRRHVLITSALALLMLGATASGAQAAKSVSGGNSLSAKACQKGGWETLMTSTTAPFVSESECVSYAAGGGVLYPNRPRAFRFELDRPTCVTDIAGRTTCENTTLVGYGLIPGEKWTMCVMKPGAEPDCYLTGYVAADGSVNYYVGQIVCVSGWQYTATVTWALAGIGCT